jgi:DNA-binding NarL/FixJ family response regulator
MADLNDLTPRELEILRLVLAGKTNKEIAHEVFISKKTVEFHLDHIYTKTDIRTRMLVGIWAMQQGLQAETGINPS